MATAKVTLPNEVETVIGGQAPKVSPAQASIQNTSAAEAAGFKTGLVNGKYVSATQAANKALKESNAQQNSGTSSMSGGSPANSNDINIAGQNGNITNNEPLSPLDSLTKQVEAYRAQLAQRDQTINDLSATNQRAQKERTSLVNTRNQGFSSPSTSTQTGSTKGVIPNPTNDPAISIYNDQITAGFGQNVENQGFATEDYGVKERARELQLRRDLGKLGFTGAGEDVLSGTEKRMGRKLNLAELENLATTEGLTVSDKERERLNAEGESALENQKITKTARMAENEYLKRQLEREFDRAIDDREEFNAAQDAKARRLAAAFGGGAYETLGTNTAIMQLEEKGQKALTDLMSEKTDKSFLISSQADEIINTYSNNVSTIQKQMAGILEDKYTSITKDLDDLITAGVTNKTDLNKAMAQAKKDYMDLYFNVSDKAQTYMQAENKRLFDQSIQLKQFQRQDHFTYTNPDTGESAEIFYNPYDQVSINAARRGIQAYTAPDGSIQSARTSDLSGVNDLGSNHKYANNCALYVESKVKGSPTGQTSIEGRKAIIAQYGSTDMSKVMPGDVILTSEGTVGHSAIVMDRRPNGDLVLDEANYKTGRVTQGRILNANDKVVLGFYKAGAASGTDREAFKGTVSDSYTPSIEAQLFGAVGNGNDAPVPASAFTPAQETQFKRFAENGTYPSSVKYPAQQRAFEAQYNSWAQGRKTSLTASDQLAAYQIAVDVAGKKGANDIAPVVEKLMMEGKNASQIKQELTSAGLSDQFTPAYRKAFAQVTQAKFSDAENAKNQQALEYMLQSGDTQGAQEFMQRLALNSVSGPVFERYDGMRRTLAAVDTIDNLLQEFRANGGDTKLLSGKAEKLKENVLGTTKNPQLAEIANQIALAIMDHRQNVSGAAFTESEARQYEQIFPGIDKSFTLNQAKINSIRNSFNSTLDTFYRGAMGSGAYNEIFSKGRPVNNTQPGVSQSTGTSALDALNYIINARNSNQSSAGGNVKVQAPNGSIYEMPERDAAQAVFEGGVIIK